MRKSVCWYATVHSISPTGLWWTKEIRMKVFMWVCRKRNGYAVLLIQSVWFFLPAKRGTVNHGFCATSALCLPIMVSVRPVGIFRPCLRSARRSWFSVCGRCWTENLMRSWWYLPMWASLPRRPSVMIFIWWKNWRTGGRMSLSAILKSGIWRRIRMFSERL